MALQLKVQVIFAKEIGANDGKSCLVSDSHSKLVHEVTDHSYGGVREYYKQKLKGLHTGRSDLAEAWR